MRKQRGLSMNADRGHNAAADPCAGVSELIGSIMLIMVVMTAVALVAVILFSQPMPSKIPNLKYITEVNGSTLYIYHNGGDSLNTGEFNVLLDGVSTSYSISDGSSQWALGKNLVVGISSVPNNVQIVYNASGSGGGVLLSQASANRVNTQNVSPDQAPYLDCSAVKNWDCRFQIPPEIIVDRYMANSSVQKTNFMKNNIISAGGLLGKLNSAQYHFNFTVTEENSTIAWGDSDCSPTTKVDLNPNDKVAIFFRSNAGPDDFIIFGMAPQIWEMAGGGLSEIGIDLTFTNGTTTHTTGSRLCHTWISRYDNLDSTLVIIGQSSGTSYTSLNVNDTFIINGQSGSNITLVNFKPVPNGMFLISWEGSATTPVFVVGWQDKIIKDDIIL
jgi:hypothetical protein